VIVREPGEEGESLGKFGFGNGRRVGLEPDHGLGQPCQHGFPVPHDGAHMAEDFQEPVAQFGLARIVKNRVQRQHDHAFVECRAFRSALSLGVAGNRDHGMEGGGDLGTVRSYFGGAGIVEEGDIVVDGDNDRLVSGKARVAHGRLEDLYERRAGFALSRNREDPPDEGRQFGSGVVGQILRRGVARKAREEGGEHGIIGADELGRRGKLCRRLGGLVVVGLLRRGSGIGLYGA
jgi:hypothetical protein